MKTQPCVLRSAFLLGAVLLTVSPPANQRAGAVDMSLSAACASNTLTLHWSGAPGFALQQSTNLTNPVWQVVPGSKGMSVCELPMTNLMALFRVANLDAFTDLDADGLDDFWETNGWTIVVDTSGYNDPGLIELRRVTSDVTLTDTDDDGIEDAAEWLMGTDPKTADTDRDGLSDLAEVVVWHTSPNAVDTDGDARGASFLFPPKFQLFDGNELSLLHTSPTLEDTDGDGRTDYEEFDQPGRSPLIAQLPRLGVELVDAVDVRLDVEYAEETGTEHQYGGELKVSDATRNQYSTSAGVNWSVSVGAQLDFSGPFPSGGNINTEVTVGGDLSVGFETETTRSVENSHSDYLTDSRTRTETSASGSVSGGIRLINTGPVTYTITDLGMTVRYLQSGDGAGVTPTFQTLATLVPSLGSDGITLAPGDSTPVLQVSATGLNATRTKQFMARPGSLHLEPAFYELENAQGLNFDYLEEVTRWRTALVQIDYGNGTHEEYRVATNVERNPTNGTCVGVTLGNVMSNILQIPFTSIARQSVQTNSPTNERILHSVRGVTNSFPGGFWSVAWAGSAAQPTNPDFADLALMPGDRILLVFVKDDDGDGLFSAEEQFYGTAGTNSFDWDGDGLSDTNEVRLGWTANVAGQPSYHVFSDPTQADQDGDRWSDLAERDHGTDPVKPDTDGDGIADNLDPHPLIPANVIRVKCDAPHGGHSVTNGAAWNTAFTNLQDALTVARNAAIDGNASNDVAEIWVASGVYKPTTSTTNRAARFELVDNTALYGGFSGVETRQSQRNRDPLSNDTILSGDLLGNDTSTPWDDPTTYNDNSYAVCYADTGVGPGTVFDGFTITGGNCTSYGGGLFCYGRPKVRNLFFRANYGINGAGFWIWLSSSSSEPYVVVDCLFLQNGAGSGGVGGLLCQGQLNAPVPQTFIITNCHFYENASLADAGALAVGQGTFLIEDCTFVWNTCTGRGGGVTVLRPATVSISRCEFLGNSATLGGSGLYLTDFLNQEGDLKVEVLQSVFWGNLTTSGYGAIAAMGANTSKRLYVLNSTLISNVTAAASGTVNATNASVLIENSILWGNSKGFTGNGTRTVRTTCLPDAASYPGAGNIGADPKVVDGATGNLRLQSGSPCIDAGNNYVDFFPTVPGFQTLSATDMDGHWRIVDGNSDGTAKVDLGAYEKQGP
jgi:hypothetical protein